MEAKEKALKVSIEKTRPIERILTMAVERGASDIHIKCGKEPVLRLAGELTPMNIGVMDQESILGFIQETLPPFAKNQWEKDAQADYSFALNADGTGRFRVNSFYQRGYPGIVFRYVKENPPTFDELKLDESIFKQLAEEHHGIVLVCGPTGSGKSSTLAAMINYINANISRHIITLEDPIEFSYLDNKSIVNQREVGVDVVDFARGLKGAMRQDPDVILVGELRDRDTFGTAMQAADTGHLVFSTVHATGAQQVIQRVLEYFPEEEQQMRSRQLAGSLRATISQRLVKSAEDNDQRVPVQEVLMMDRLAKNVIEEGKFQKLQEVIEAGGDIGSRSFNMDLKRLVDKGWITEEVALANSPNPKALQMNLKGIYLSSGGIMRS